MLGENRNVATPLAKRRQLDLHHAKPKVQILPKASLAHQLLERAMVLAERDTIGVEDLPERIREARDPIQLHLTSGELSIKKTSRVIEEILIRRALQKTKGNRTRAAEVLEISHRALLYKIKDYRIDL